MKPPPTPSYRARQPPPIILPNLTVKSGIKTTVAVDTVEKPGHYSIKSPNSYTVFSFPHHGSLGTGTTIPIQPETTAATTPSQPPPPPQSQPKVYYKPVTVSDVYYKPVQGHQEPLSVEEVEIESTEESTGKISIVNMEYPRTFVILTNNHILYPTRFQRHKIENCGYQANNSP